jgi:hypothetical protein
MGQARAKRDALRQMLLKKGQEWDFPPSLWEAAVCAELREEDVVIVPRAPADQLAWMRMPANKCHANARWYVQNDPSRKARVVTGWWVQWPVFVLHSVIETDGQLICITPSPYNEVDIPFIPDSKISWVEDGKVYSAVRLGQIVGPGVRVFPAFTMAQNAIVRERLLSGMDPLKAGEFTDEELDLLKRQHIPSSAAAS